jgi:hypothetical protein
MMTNMEISMETRGWYPTHLLRYNHPWYEGPPEFLFPPMPFANRETISNGSPLVAKKDRTGLPTVRVQLLLLTISTVYPSNWETTLRA